MIKKITEGQFSEVKEKKIALIDFSATWCGPCKMIAPVLEEISEEMASTLSFYNVDVDECPGLAQEFQIVSIPSLVLLKEGKKVDMQVGFIPKDAIIKFIKDNM